MVRNDKSRIIKYVLGMIVATLILFVFIFLIKLANWYIDWFSTAGFSIVVYQLKSPIQGTAGDILDSFKREALLGSIIITFAVIFFFVLCDMTFSAGDVEIKLHLGTKDRVFDIGRDKYRKFRRIVSVLLSVVLVGLIVLKMYEVGVPQYLREISDSSTIYEDEYVDPSEASVSFPDNKRNLLFIYMESMESSFADKASGGGSDVDYIPNLKKLAEDNINFSSTEKLGGFHIYGIGFTMAGLLASSAGVNYKIPVRNETANYFQAFLPGIVSIGDILEDEGYHNYFLCGSDGEFGGREQFYTQHGNYEILDLEYAQQSGYIPEDYHNESWGYEDLYLYEIAKQELTAAAAKDEPFNFTMLTVDTHNPAGFVCAKCPDTYDDQYANVISCADSQILDFVEWVKTQPWYENTTIVIMGDHTTMVSSFIEYPEDYEREVYDCFINPAPGLDLTHTKMREFSTCDIFPTIVASLGAKIDGERLGIGVNLFSGEPTIPERIGKEVFYNELQRNSRYYTEKFINGN